MGKQPRSNRTTIETLDLRNAQMLRKIGGPPLNINLKICGELLEISMLVMFRIVSGELIFRIRLTLPHLVDRDSGIGADTEYQKTLPRLEYVLVGNSAQHRNCCNGICWH